VLRLLSSSSPFKDEATEVGLDDSTLELGAIVLLLVEAVELLLAVEIVDLAPSVMILNR